MFSIRCKLKLGKFVVTFSRLQRANFNHFLRVGEIFAKLGNCSALNHRFDRGKYTANLERRLFFNCLESA